MKKPLKIKLEKIGDKRIRIDDEAYVILGHLSIEHDIAIKTLASEIIKHYAGEVVFEDVKRSWSSDKEE